MGSPPPRGADDEYDTSIAPWPQREGEYVPNLVDLCLNLTDADARHQWRRISARQPQQRQEPYLPIELVLCFGFFRLVNPHQFGGASLHRLPQAMRTLANTFKRPVAR